MPQSPASPRGEALAPCRQKIYPRPPTSLTLPSPIPARTTVGRRSRPWGLDAERLEAGVGPGKGLQDEISRLFQTAKLPRWPGRNGESHQGVHDLRSGASGGCHTKYTEAPAGCPAVRKDRQGMIAPGARKRRSRAPRGYSSPILRAWMNASCGISTLPNCRIFFLPAFCLSSSLRLRVTSPP